MDMDMDMESIIAGRHIRSYLLEIVKFVLEVIPREKIQLVFC